VAEAAVPESIVHYVVRTQESVILDDAAYKIAREIPRVILAVEHRRYSELFRATQSLS
jgi:hypothetical protein